MRRLARSLTAAAVLLAAACTMEIPPSRPASGGGNGGSGGGTVSAPAGSSVQEMASLVNEYRRGAGCPALAWLEGAARAAQAHSDDMARRNYFDHTSPEGQGPVERLRAQGVGMRMLAENIALNPGSAREVLRGWQQSSGHNQNLRNCGYTHHGIGERNGRWTHVFVTPA